MHFHVYQVLGVIIHNQTGLEHSMTAVSLALQSHCVLNRNINKGLLAVLFSTILPPSSLD